VNISVAPEVGKFTLDQLGISTSFDAAVKVPITFEFDIFCHAIPSVHDAVFDACQFITIDAAIGSDCLARLAAIALAYGAFENGPSSAKSVDHFSLHLHAAKIACLQKTASSKCLKSELFWAV
jgi:hypothetical protein